MSLNPQPSALFCFGSPLLDITAHVDSSFLIGYNLAEDSAYSLTDQTKKIFEEIRPISVAVGGSVTNTTRVVKKLLPTTDVIFFGTVGSDDSGDLIKKALEREELGEGLTQVQGHTGKVAVLLKGKSRTLITDLGVSCHFKLNDVIKNKLNKNVLVYLSGFFLPTSPSTIPHLLSSESQISLNLGSTFIPKNFPQELVALYQRSSLIFGNEAEHRSLGAVLSLSHTSLIDVVIGTNEKVGGVSRTVIVTRGGNSVFVVRNSDWWEFNIPPIKIIDTNGAGDAFVGGFLAGFIKNAPIRECVGEGIRVAGRVIQQIGFNIDDL